MKKTSLLIALLFTLFLVTACGDVDNINPENIQINEALGLNEQIYLSLGKLANREYVVSYKAADAKKYTVVDKELLLEEEDSIGCYILGLKEGKYSVRVECGEDKTLSRVTLNDIDVERQDRYNKFIHTNKTILLGGWEYDYQLNTTIHHNHYIDVTQRLPISRNSNIHNYNNYYDNCLKALSPRTSTYIFSEGNYFKNVQYPTYIGDSSEEIWGVIKSYNDIFEKSGDTYMVFTVKSREEMITKVSYTCFPDEQTDYSKFDTDPTLFYYDVENKCSDVEILHKAEDVPDVVPVYAGAGVLTKLELDN